MTDDNETPVASVTPLHGTPLLSGKAGKILNSLYVDEPVFILRAKDILSTMSVLHYMTLVETYNPHSEVIESLTELLAKFREWQQANPQLIKLPD